MTPDAARAAADELTRLAQEDGWYGPLTLVLPEPPSANRYWRLVRGRAVVSAEARAYRRTVTALAGHLRPIAGPSPVRVRIAWHRGRRSGDLDNRLKQVLDCLCGLAYEDDAQIVELYATRHDDPKNPRVEITVAPVHPACAS